MEYDAFMIQNYIGSREGSKDEPCARIYQSMTGLKHHLFVYGGLDIEWTSLNDDIWLFDIYTQTWSNINIVPQVHDSTSCYRILPVGKNLYLFGCKMKPFNITNSNYISIYDGENQLWDIAININGDEDDTDDSMCDIGSMFLYENSIYILATASVDSSYMVLLKYDIVRRFCAFVQHTGEPPGTKFRKFGCVFDNKYYCFGEKENSDENPFNSIYIFDLKKNEWSMRATFADYNEYPCERVGFSICFSQTHGYLSGGMCNYTYKLDEIWSIDLRTLRWQKLEQVRPLFIQKLDVSVMGHSSFIYDDNTLYIFGGMNENDCLINRIQKYYIKPPPLCQLSFLIAMKTSENEIQQLPGTLNLLP